MIDEVILYSDEVYDKKRIKNRVKSMITTFSTFWQNKICTKKRIQICNIKMVLH